MIIHISLLSWDANDCHVNLEKELAIITEQAPEGEDARYGERLIQFASENLVTEVLIHPAISTLSQCMKNLLSSFTRHRHIIHAGYTFAGNGSWILQDGTFSLTDFSEAFQEIEVQRILRAYDNTISLDIHCSTEGDWSRLSKEPFTKNSKLRVNPDDVLTSGSPAIVNFLNYISPFLIPTDIEMLLESSDVVGNIRFSHPTLYVFPGGQGDAALFGINGFNMLVDGGFGRKACFWDFVRHLDRLDAVLLTRLNNSNVNGISSVLRRKRHNTVYPQIGHFFCNIQERKAILSPDGDKDKDPLLVNIFEEGQDIMNNLRQLNLQPQSCYRDVEPINLYHKVGHGTLDMYILSPSRDSREVREFLQKWNTNDQKLFANQRINGKEFIFPTYNLVSICALLVWQPANTNDNITRILFPGSSPQHKIFEGLDKIKQLECVKYSTCSAKTLTPGIIKTKLTKPEKIIQEQKEIKLKPQPIEIKTKMENKIVEENVKNGHTNGVTGNQNISEKLMKKHDSTESDKSGPQSIDSKKVDAVQEIVNGKTPDEKSIEKSKSRAKPEQKIKPETKSGKNVRSIERKVKLPLEKKASPTTPKKTVETKMNGDVPSKTKPSTIKTSPSATPAKSAKEANNRKVVESKYKAAPKKDVPKAADKKEGKPERKPISRRPKGTSPIGKVPESPVRKISELHKVEARKPKLEKECTTDSSTVSTPSADVETALKKDLSKLTPEELEQIKERELAELKEEQEVVKEIEAVFRKSETKHDDDSDIRKVKSISIDEKTDGDGEEYLIIEKEEIEHDSLDEKDIKESETQKHTRDSEESEKQRKLSDVVENSEVKHKLVDKREEEQIEKPQDDVSSIPPPKEETERPKPLSKDISVTSPDDKIEESSGKKITDKDHEEDNKDINILESLPDEKYSTPIESGATTAPTLPEDERIPLDEIKEDNGDQAIEEKYVKEETKEKEIPVVQLPPKSIDPVNKVPNIVGIRLDRQTPMRDIVKTPDEVADLPVHEVVDIDNFDQYQLTPAHTPKQEDIGVKEKSEMEQDKPDNDALKKQEVEKEYVDQTPKEQIKHEDVSKPVDEVELLPEVKDDGIIKEEVKICEVDGAKDEQDKGDELQITHEVKNILKSYEEMKGEDVRPTEEKDDVKIPKEDLKKDDNMQLAQETKQGEPTKEEIKIVDPNTLEERDAIEVKIESEKIEEKQAVMKESETLQEEKHDVQEENYKEKVDVTSEKSISKKDRLEKTDDKDEKTEFEPCNKEIHKLLKSEKQEKLGVEKETQETDDREKDSDQSTDNINNVISEPLQEDHLITKDDSTRKVEKKEDPSKKEEKDYDTIEKESDVGEINELMTQAESLLSKYKIGDDIDDAKDVKQISHKVEMEHTSVTVETHSFKKDVKETAKETEDEKDKDTTEELKLEKSEESEGVIEEVQLAKKIELTESQKILEDLKDDIESIELKIADQIEDQEMEDSIINVLQDAKEIIDSVSKIDHEDEFNQKETPEDLKGQTDSTDIKEIQKTVMEETTVTETVTVICEPEIVSDAHTEEESSKLKEDHVIEEPVTKDHKEELQTKQEIVEECLTENLDSIPLAVGSTQESAIASAQVVEEFLTDDQTSIKTFRADSLEISKIDKKLQELKDSVGTDLPTVIKLEPKVELDIVDKLELGRKSPKEREEDVAKIVASVAEVLKSDAPLEEFEGKLPLDFNKFTPYTTELRETHITTVESPIRDVIVETTLMDPIEEEKVLDPTSMFINEERKISEVHVDYDSKEKDSDTRVSSLLKDSTELIQATTKMLSDIKQSAKAEEPTTKYEEEADSKTVDDSIKSESNKEEEEKPTPNIADAVGISSELVKSIVSSVEHLPCPIETKSATDEKYRSMEEANIIDTTKVEETDLKTTKNGIQPSVETDPGVIDSAVKEVDTAQEGIQLTDSLKKGDLEPNEIKTKSPICSGKVSPDILASETETISKTAASIVMSEVIDKRDDLESTEIKSKLPPSTDNISLDISAVEAEIIPETAVATVISETINTDDNLEPIAIKSKSPASTDKISSDILEVVTTTTAAAVESIKEKDDVPTETKHKSPICSGKTSPDMLALESEIIPETALAVAMNENVNKNIDLEPTKLEIKSLTSADKTSSDISALESEIIPETATVLARNEILNKKIDLEPTELESKPITAADILTLESDIKSETAAATIETTTEKINLEPTQLESKSPKSADEVSSDILTSKAEIISETVETVVLSEIMDKKDDFDATEITSKSPVHAEKTSSHFEAIEAEIIPEVATVVMAMEKLEPLQDDSVVKKIEINQISSEKSSSDSIKDEVVEIESVTNITEAKVSSGIDHDDKGGKATTDNEILEVPAKDVLTDLEDTLKGVIATRILHDDEQSKSFDKDNIEVGKESVLDERDPMVEEIIIKEKSPKLSRSASPIPKDNDLKESDHKPLVVSGKEEINVVPEDKSLPALSDLPLEIETISTSDKISDLVQETGLESISSHESDKTSLITPVDSVEVIEKVAHDVIAPVESVEVIEKVAHDVIASVESVKVIEEVAHDVIDVIKTETSQKEENIDVKSISEKGINDVDVVEKEDYTPLLDSHKASSTEKLTEDDNKTVEEVSTDIEQIDLKDVVEKDVFLDKSTIDIKENNLERQPIEEKLDIALETDIEKKSVEVEEKIEVPKLESTQINPVEEELDVKDGLLQSKMASSEPLDVDETKHEKDTIISTEKSIPEQTKDEQHLELSSKEHKTSGLEPKTDLKLTVEDSKSATTELEQKPSDEVTEKPLEDYKEVVVEKDPIKEISSTEPEQIKQSSIDTNIFTKESDTISSEKAVTESSSGKSTPDLKDVTFEKKSTGKVTSELVLEDADNNIVVSKEENEQSFSTVDEVLSTEADIKSTSPVPLEKFISVIDKPEPTVAEPNVLSQTSSGRSSPEITEITKDLLDTKKSPILSRKSTPEIVVDSEFVVLDRLSPERDIYETEDKSSVADTKDKIIDEHISQTTIEPSQSSVEVKVDINEAKQSFEVLEKTVSDVKTTQEPSSILSVVTEGVVDHPKETVVPDVKEEQVVSKAGPSSVTETESVRTEEIELSRKSTPDIADIVKITDKEEISLGRKTPPTAPVSPIVKDKFSSSHEKQIKDDVTIVKTDIRSSTPASDDCDISSGQVSRVLTAEDDDEKQVYSDDEEIPGSPLSATSQIAHSTSSQYDFEDSVRGATVLDPMSTSFYGALPDDPIIKKTESTSEKSVSPTSSPSHFYEITTAKYSSLNLQTQHETEPTISALPETDIMSASFIGSELPSDSKDDPIASWGKPLGLPSPAPVNDNKGTPKKERKIPSNVVAKNKLNEDKKNSDSKYDKKGKKLNPVYVDLTYVPHNGNSNYSYIDFFKRIRARYYVFSGIEPSKEVYNALLEAKQTWDDKELEVTIIPTYDTDVLGYWVAENEDLLAKYKIDLSPSASRCTINLQDHETSCSAYRLEFS
ncbi:hypothetical protein FQR65_LT09097 [Abscondita terminalis]|nr:hypothetical protein FQR65_LT09097 [Abscondita terminalis]